MLYACLLLYVTLIYVRPAEIVPEWATIPFVDILTGISAAIGIFSIAAKPRKILDLPQDKLLLAFWAIIVISSFKVWFSGVYYAFLAFMPPVFVYFLIRASVQSLAQLKGLAYLLIALNVFLAVNGIVQYHTGVGLGDVGMVLDRIYGLGIFNDPNDLGMTFVMAVPFVLLMIGLRGTWLIFRILGIIVLGVLLVAMYYTNSRGAILGLDATMVAYSFIKFSKPKATVVSAVLIALVTVAAPSRGSEMTFDESSAQTRIQSWAEGWAMLKSHPLTGVGYDQYTEYHYAVAHNSFVHTFAELGLHRGLYLRRDVLLVLQGLESNPRFEQRVPAMAPRSDGERNRDAGVRLVPLAAVRPDLLHAAGDGSERGELERAARGKKQAANSAVRRYLHLRSDDLLSHVRVRLHSHHGSVGWLITRQPSSEDPAGYL